MAQKKPKIIVVIAPKGGVGKTTLTTGLLVSARRAGLRAVGIGMDKQRSLEKWAVIRERQRKTPQGTAFLEVPVQTLSVDDYHRLAFLTKVDVVVVDTPPGHVEAATSVDDLCAMADLILIPTCQTPIDLLEVIPFRKRLAARHSFFVLNRVKRRTSQYSRAKAQLMGSGRLCPADVPDRDAIPNQFAKGLVVEDEAAPGTEYFQSLWNFVANELGLPPSPNSAGEEGDADAA